MKFILDDFKEQRAERLFVDRIEPRQIFWQQFADAKKGRSEPLVLHYYGVGGIGKSSLHAQLTKELAQRCPGAKSVVLDFDFVERREPYRILNLLKRKLADAYGFSFPLFDVACYTFLCRIGEDADIGEVQSLVGNSPLLTFLCDAASMVPGTSMVTGILKLVDEGVAVARNLFSNRKQLLRRLETTDIRLLRSQLPAYFAADLRENLQAEREPFVIFLDTYEKLVDEFASVGDPLQNDWWLRGKDGLIPRLPGVLWVLGGREKLKWPVLDGPGTWDGVLHQYLLGTLARQDADEFLRAAGVADQASREQIFSLSGGLPVSLDLYVEQYHIQGSVSGAIPPAALHERVVRYMSDDEKNACYLLAHLGRWTHPQAAEAARLAGVSLSPTLYDKLCGFSFIQTEDGELCTMMRQVAEVLRANCPASLGRTLAALPSAEETAAAAGNAGAANLAAAAPTKVPISIPEAPTARSVEMALRGLENEEACIDWLLESLEEALDRMRRRLELDTYFSILAPIRRFARKEAPGGVLELLLDGFDGIGLYYAGKPQRGEQILRGALEALCRQEGSAARSCRHTVSIQYFFVTQARCNSAAFAEIAPRLWQQQLDENDIFLAAATARRLAQAYDYMEWPEQAALWHERGEAAPPPADAASSGAQAPEAPASGAGAGAGRLNELLEELGRRLNAQNFSPEDQDAVRMLLEDGQALAARVYGPDSLEAFRWRCEACNAYGQMGDAQAMLEALGQALALCARFSGEDSGVWAIVRAMELHVQTMLAMSDDWAVLERIGAEMEPVRAILERQLGPRRSDTQDAAYLCRLFKRISGCTVAEYRQQLQAVQADPHWAPSEGRLGYAASLLDVIDAFQGSCDDQMVVQLFGPGWGSGTTPPAGPVSAAPYQDGGPEALVCGWMETYRPAGLFTSVTGIPEKRLRNALRSYGGGEDAGRVLVLLDTTILGSGKSGLLLLSDCIVYKDLLGRKGRVPLTKLDPFTREDIKKGDGNFIVLNTKDAPDRARFTPEGADETLQVLNLLTDLIRNGQFPDPSL